ncbi:hypothetical protein GUITHDRAFT_105574 [Guillardia theta CCMP2712]|uniref:Uncharacterized protein n=1 Tax=Guillardia theta (strain CCMP2712) TaxID=905079 RepID=L1JKU4_GUITC|nr:hypothetical protein GUITHDRAFT_105574 [Guillardia theta CCMP2712]EKX48947.1 hypothetical protein GUITHDRAFT_105574 [Guillardia theta CCMP2712]|eukprot:XP_005835927.1 hypothetical protein GUITHDRAFT_105574 [Guillardia theta CCMP2712]
MKPLPHVDPHGWQNVEIEKPLDFWIRSLSFDKPSLLRDHMNSMGWPDRVLARHWEFGFSSQELMNIFVSLPGHCTRSRSSWRTWEQSLGTVKQHLHPSTGKRAHVYISDTLCKIVGLHAEEVLARIANRELSLVTTEFEYFCYVMFGTWLYATSPGRPLVLPMRVDKDSFIASKEPAGSPSALFEKHMCGGRDYDTLLNDFDADMFAGATILGMQKSKQGMQLLEALGRDLEQMFQPLVEHAEKILEEKARERA